MLETVKSYISSGPCIYKTFDQYFSDYVCNIQDLLIDKELKYLESSVGYSNYNKLITITNKEAASTC